MTSPCHCKVPHRTGIVQSVSFICHGRLVIKHSTFRCNLVESGHCVKPLDNWDCDWKPGIILIAPANVLFPFFVCFVAFLLTVESISNIDLFKGLVNLRQFIRIIRLVLRVINNKLSFPCLKSC